MPIEKITRVSGTALPVRGNNIDTDRIIPARFLRSVSFDGLERHLFEDDCEQSNGTHALLQPQFTGAALMFVNANFGCGSSREHAPQAIRRRGVRAVVGESFSEIFFGNSVALGMPCPTVTAEGAALLQGVAETQPATTFTIDLNQMTIEGGGLTLALSMPAAAREAFLDGSWDATAQLLHDYDAVRAVARRLPYVGGW
jgi:3-isopropylmalate/(R)-2-methylmalate dehydratase small subunit